MQVLTIDLFSGIGGVPLALKGFCKSVLYCDNDAFCQQVLTERMREDRIERAPVHSDICNLYLSPDSGAEMICATTPCQDISCIGLQKGIQEGTRSGLFLEVMRLLDQNPTIKVAFFENVSNIVRCGLKEVVEELTARKFTFAWTMRSAGSVGAPHQRARWFCLAIRDDFDVNRFDLNQEVDPPFLTSWDAEPDKRYSFKPTFREDDSYDPNWSQRLQTLGNTVCPLAVRTAFVELVKLHRNRQGIIDSFGDFSTDITQLSYPYPENGMVHGGKYYALPKFEKDSRDPKLEITLKHAGKDLTYQRYPTPRKGITHASTLTDRSTRDLPTILVNCDQTRADMEALGVQLPEKLHTIATANVPYIEWMMGYPKNWTKVQDYKKKKVYVDLDIPEEDASVDITSSSKRRSRTRRSTTSSGRSWFNGMHVLMREHPGHDVRSISAMWRALSDEEKAAYTAKAKELAVTPADA